MTQSSPPEWLHECSGASVDWTGKHVLVFAGGEVHHTTVARTLIKSFDRICCADSGLTPCLEAGLRPDLLLGDMDSVPQRSLDALDSFDPPVEQQRHPPEKAASDLELMLHVLAERSVASVHLLGVSGGRTDHMLFNWMLPAIAQWPFELALSDQTTDATVVDSRQALTLSVPSSSVVSVLPVGGTVEGLCLEGFHYPLDQATVALGSTLGLSNVTAGLHARVSVASGRVLVLVNVSSGNSSTGTP